MYKAFLIKYGEIGVKGKNRYLFEDALVRQIRFALEKVEGEFVVSKENGTIPNQVHLQELMKILDNAKEYLDFLKKEDEYGTIAEKIISIAKFRIPYYVGPLSRRHKEER